MYLCVGGSVYVRTCIVMVCMLQIFSWSCDHLAKSCDQIELLQASEALCIVRCMIVSLLSLSSCTVVSNILFSSLVCVSSVSVSLCHCLFLCCITTYVPPKTQRLTFLLHSDVLLLHFITASFLKLTSLLTLFYSSLSLSFFFFSFSLGFHKNYVHTRMMCCEMPTLYFFSQLAH